MAELDIKQAVFTFVDGSQKTLEGVELEDWETICLMHSDYLLPGGPDYVLAFSYGGLVRGFVPRTALSKPGGSWEVK